MKDAEDEYSFFILFAASFGCDPGGCMMMHFQEEDENRRKTPMIFNELQNLQCEKEKVRGT